MRQRINTQEIERKGKILSKFITYDKLSSIMQDLEKQDDILSEIVFSSIIENHTTSLESYGKIKEFLLDIDAVSLIYIQSDANSNLEEFYIPNIAKDYTIVNELNRFLIDRLKHLVRIYEKIKWRANIKDLKVDLRNYLGKGEAFIATPQHVRVGAMLASIYDALIIRKALNNDIISTYFIDEFYDYSTFILKDKEVQGINAISANLRHILDYLYENAGDLIIDEEGTPGKNDAIWLKIYKVLSKDKFFRIRQNIKQRFDSFLKIEQIIDDDEFTKCVFDLYELFLESNTSEVFQQKDKLIKIIRYVYIKDYDIHEKFLEVLKDRDDGSDIDQFIFFIFVVYMRMEFAFLSSVIKKLNSYVYVYIKSYFVFLKIHENKCPSSFLRIIKHILNVNVEDVALMKKYIKENREEFNI